VVVMKCNFPIKVLCFNLNGSSLGAVGSGLLCSPPTVGV
jgi:hypothetical protein